MKKETAVQDKIESSFRTQVQKDNKVNNAYLLVHSEKLGVDLNLAEGETDGIKANINQPVHLASVGKLFTATLISILYERNQLDFHDPIATYLDAELMDDLHVFKGKEYSDQITIRHLLMQTSGLNDVFYQLFEKLTKEPGFNITPREAVFWAKENLNPVAPPDTKHFYADTNFYLLGLIVESITGKPFHSVMHQEIFQPLGMQHARMYGYSEPEIDPGAPPARLYINDVDLLTVEGVHEIDYAGGCVMAPLDDFLKFFKALVDGKLIKEETLTRMIEDDVTMGFPMMGFDYGYAIWKFKTIPVLLPEKYKCWGCVGATGAFLFYHPSTESFIIGSFNDFSYKAKSLQFMMKHVVKELIA